MLVSNYRYGVMLRVFEDHGLVTMATGASMNHMFAVLPDNYQLYSILSRLTSMVSNAEIHSSLTKHTQIDTQVTLNDFIRANWGVVFLTASKKVVIWHVWKNFDFEDWRDYKFIDESKANKYENIWLTAFYGLHTIRVDFANATTDMNKHDITKDKLVDVNKDIKLSFVDHSKTTIICDNDAETPEPLVNTLTNDLRLSGYNKASKGVKSTYDYITEHFGYIKYMNKGANVSKFHVHIPVTFIYDWGEISRKICITVIGTEGNNMGEDDPDYDDSIHQGTHIVKK